MLKKLSLGAFIALALVLVAAAPVFAQDGVVEGTVQSVDEVAGTISLLASDGTVVTVVAPAGTDFSLYPAGIYVQISGDLSEEGVLTATSILIVSGEEDIDPSKPGFYCSNPDFTQPALGKLADTYETDYGQVLNMYCQGGLGVGGVQLALAAGQTYGLTPEEIAAMRAEHLGWGQIMKQLEATYQEQVTTQTEAQNGNSSQSKKDDNPGQATKAEKSNQGKSANAPGRNK